MANNDDDELLTRPPQDVLAEAAQQKLSQYPNILKALSAVGQKSQELSENIPDVDKYTGRPVRAAALAALSGENPLTAVQQSVSQDQDVTGEQVAQKFLQRTEEAGLPLRAPGQEEYPLQKPLGSAIESASRSLVPVEGTVTSALGTLRNVPTVAAAVPKAASRYKTIASALEGGKTVASELPRNKIVNALRELKISSPEVTHVLPSKGLEDVNKLKTAQEYLDKIARRRAEMELAKRLETPPTMTWGDVARLAR